MKVGIVGLGLIGGSLAIDLRAEKFATHVIGVDSSPEHCRQARSRGLCDEFKELNQAARESDLLILAVPVNAIASLLPQVLDQIPDATTVIDMGSTKSAICKTVIGHARREQFVATHPMAGTEHSGPLAALRGLFRGRTTVICDTEKSGAPHLRRVDALYDALGMHKVYMTSDEHDLHAAFVSHLSHISSFVLANTVLDQERSVSTIFDLAGGGFESTVRLAKSSPDMWLPIFQQNQESVLAALNTYIEHLEEFRRSLQQQDGSKTYQLMKDANEIKRVLGQVRASPSTPSSQNASLRSQK